MSAKEKISLTKEQESLLIPLYAKAQDNPLFDDKKAWQILASVEYDFTCHTRGRFSRLALWC